MCDCIDMTVSGGNLSDETLNRGPWRFSCGGSMNFPLDLMQNNFQIFSKFQSKIHVFLIAKITVEILYG